MKKIINLTLIILYCICSLISGNALAIDDAGSKKVFSIEDCIDFAIQNSPNIKVAREKVKVQKSKVGQAKSNYFPTLGAGNSYDFSLNKTSGRSSTDKGIYDINISINQLIWDFGKTTANINMQKYNEQSAKFDLNFEILSTIYKVKMSYFDVLAAKANSEIAEKTLQINKLNYDRTKALFDEGLKSKIDVVNAEVYYTDSHIRLLEAEQKHKTALIALANSMYFTDSIDFSVLNTENFNFKPINYKPNEIDIEYLTELQNGQNSELVLTSGIAKHNILEEFNFKPYEITIPEAIQQANKSRPDLMSLQLVQKASEESLKAIKKSYFPELSVGAGYNFNLAESTNSNGLRVSAGLDIPLLNIMSIKNKIDEGEAYLEIAKENVNLAEKNIYFEVQNYFVEMKQLEKRIPLMAKKVEQTLENFELADGRYTVGLGNFIELQDAQTNYNNAQLEFVQVVFNYNVAREKFLKSMGVK